MAFDNQQEQQDQAGTGESTDGGANDLSGVLGGQDATFVTGEKKPIGTGTVLMAGFLLACGAGTYLMYTRSAPANATPTAEAAAAQTTINEFLSDDKGNVSKMRDLLENTEKAVEQFRASPGKKQIPIEDLRTNPFRLTEEEAEAGEETDGDDVRAKRREAEAKAAALKAAQALNLQFIMSGGRKGKSCMINNAVYREGQAVSEFTVETIGTNTVVLRKGDGRFELTMKK